MERFEELLKTIFFIYNQRKKQSSAQKDIFGTYSTSFWKFCVLLSVKSPNIFRKVCAKIIITIAHNTKRRRPRFRKNQKLFFKYSVAQDISNAFCCSFFSFFSNQIVGEVSGHQKTTTSHSFYKKRFLQDKKL